MHPVAALNFWRGTLDKRALRDFHLQPEAGEQPTLPPVQRFRQGHQHPHDDSSGFYTNFHTSSRTHPRSPCQPLPVLMPVASISPPSLSLAVTLPAPSEYITHRQTPNCNNKHLAMQRRVGSARTTICASNPLPVILRKPKKLCLSCGSRSKRCHLPPMPLVLSPLTSSGLA